MEKVVRWNIKVSKESEVDRWRVFHRTVQDILGNNSDTDPKEFLRIIDETVSEVLSERHSRERLKELDVGGAGYQHPGFRADDSNGKPGRNLSGLSGGRFTLHLRARPKRTATRST